MFLVEFNAIFDQKSSFELVTTCYAKHKHVCALIYFKFVFEFFIFSNPLQSYSKHDVNSRHEARVVSAKIGC